MYDEYLKGESGAIKYYSDAKGNRLDLAEVYLEASKGMNVYLTIDINIQLALERELNNASSTLEPDNSLGIVIDPNTGEILAMASRPDYNPNHYQEFTKEVLNRNLPIWMTYEPGSTFKIVTLSASVNEGIVDLNNDRFFDGGAITVEGATLHCWKHGGHGDQTYLQVVENSCNLVSWQEIHFI